MKDFMHPFEAKPSEFVVEAKDPSPASLERWRKAALVRNATRRFR